MTATDLLTIVLAAGKGTRMRSSRPKVLHEIAGQSMLAHVLRSTEAVGGPASRTAVVVGPEMERVAIEARRIRPGAELFLQADQRGTADAVLAARSALSGHSGDVLVVYGDTPLLTSKTLAALLDRLNKGVNVAVLGFEARDPTGYGRLIVDSGGRLSGIREEQDATAEERSVRLCNSGVMAFRSPDLVGILDRIGNANAKGEYYLTDVIGIACQQGLATGVEVCREDEVMGVNSRDQLAVAEGIFQQRARAEAMAAGVTMVAPETVWLAYDTRFGRDVTIEPNVVFGPGVEIADNVEILAFSHIAGAKIETGARIGPYARIRPGSTVGVQAHVGNFVELKNTQMERGAKVNHLAYVGDGRIGREANIGAGTIFCNYDGFNKHRTDIGAGAFVGSNSALVAPVTIGEGAYVGSGSVITRDIPADALGLERAELSIREGWAAKFRIVMGRRRPKTG